MNTQREVIYKQRRQVLDGEDVHGAIENMLSTMITSTITGHAGEQGKLDEEAFKLATAHLSGSVLTPGQLLDFQRKPRPWVRKSWPRRLLAAAQDNYAKREEEINTQMAPLMGGSDKVPMRELERVILLRVGGRVLDGPDRRHDRAAPGHRPAGLRPV